MNYSPRSQIEISPSHYSLRHDRDGVDHTLLNWVLEGKVDDSDTSAWMVLKEHVNDNSLGGGGRATCSWPVAHIGINHSFRYIRIRTTGVNSKGNFYLMCGGIELYGDLYVIS